MARIRRCRSPLLYAESLFLFRNATEDINAIMTPRPFPAHLPAEQSGSNSLLWEVMGCSYQFINSYVNVALPS